jgi:hypothetical protein
MALQCTRRGFSHVSDEVYFKQELKSAIEEADSISTNPSFIKMWCLEDFMIESRSKARLGHPST